jgi:glutamate-1-semialdehyde aminotransferase
MDALDGGFWQFGDDSVPPSGVTYFAGTFVRHPLTMAAAKAALVHMKEGGPELQETLNDRTVAMVRSANDLFDKYQLPYRWVNFGSAFKTKYDESVNYTELFFLLMRYHGVHVLDFPHFLTTAHTEADVDDPGNRGEDLRGTARQRLYAGAHLPHRNGEQHLERASPKARRTHC